MSYYEPETTGQPERVQKIPISDLKPFRNHPFRVVDDESMLRTTESISMFGVLTPLLARYFQMDLLRLSPVTEEPVQLKLQVF